MKGADAGGWKRNRVNSSNQLHARQGNARVAIASMFFCFGMSGGTWASRIPAIRDHDHINNGQLGVALLAIPIGVTVSIHTLGRINHRFGSGVATRLAIAMSAGSLCLPPFSNSLSTLAFVLFILGASWGLLDVSMNTQASILEHRYGRPIMSSFHAFFSLGALVGAICGGAAAHFAIAPRIHLAAVALAVSVWAVVTTRWLLDAQADRNANEESSRGSQRNNRWSLGLVLLAGIAFCGSLCEGTAYDWSGVYATDVVHASQMMGAIGLVGYSMAMCGVRFIGDHVTGRFGSARILQVSGLVVGVGFGGGLLLRNAPSSVLAWTLLGIGVGVVVPTAISLVGKVSIFDRSRSIARIAGAGWIGSVSGPPLVGQLSQVMGLHRALMVPALLGLLITALGTGWAVSNRDAINPRLWNMTHGQELSTPNAPN